ncbi:MAG: HAD family phosphatase [Lachnospiraceae bacterium]|nr:HAD family phosphatase [Lachnospiraceae bacterium]
MIKAILFDLNGVLIDSERINIEVWKKVFENYGLEFDERLYVQLIDGRTTKEIAQEFVGGEKIREFVELKDRIWYELFEEKGVTVFDDTIPFLIELKSRNIKTAVISSSRKVKFILECLDMSQYFDIVIGGGDIVCGKPSPEIVLKAMNFLNMDTSEVALVEDSIAGLDAGKKAGVYCIAIRRNEKNVFIEYDQLINNLSEIKLKYKEVNDEQI